LKNYEAAPHDTHGLNQWKPLFEHATKRYGARRCNGLPGAATKVVW
jgi:hypothetical protein